MENDGSDARMTQWPSPHPVQFCNPPCVFSVLIINRGLMSVPWGGSSGSRRLPHEWASRSRLIIALSFFFSDIGRSE